MANGNDTARGSLNDPVSWGRFVQQVGIPGATIFALLALLGYLAFKAVPAVIDLTIAIQLSTTSAERRQSDLLREDNQILSEEAEIIGGQERLEEQHRGVAAALQHHIIVSNEIQEQICINAAKSTYQVDQCRQRARADSK